MLLAVTGTAETAAETARAMDGMGGGSGGTAHFRTLALVLAFALFGYVVWNADRLSSLPPVAVLAARATAAPARAVPLSLRLAVCCEIAMGLAMGYMLILML